MSKKTPLRKVALKEPDTDKGKREAEMRQRGLISVAAASRECRVSKATIYTWVRSGALTPQPFGMRSYYLKIDELRKLLPEIRDAAIA